MPGHGAALRRIFEVVVPGGAGNQNAHVRGAKVLGVVHNLRESLETVARQIPRVISSTSQRVPYLTVQSHEPAAELLDRRLSRRLTLRLRYNGSFWDALHGGERISGRNSPLRRISDVWFASSIRGVDMRRTKKIPKARAAASASNPAAAMIAKALSAAFFACARASLFRRSISPLICASIAE